MFRPKTTQVPGVCLANRCKTVTTLETDNPYGLCAQHYNEWTAASKPELQAKAPKATPADSLAVVRAEIEPVRTGAEQALAFAASVQFEAQLPIGFLGSETPLTGLQALCKVREMARLQLKNIEEKRTSITKPMLEAKRKVDDLFKPAAEQCEAVMCTCDDRLNAHARAGLEAQRLAAAQLHTSPHDPTLLAVAQGTASAPLPEEVRAQHVFKFRVLDFAAVPNELKLLNDRAVQLLIDSKRGQIQIPGLEIFEDVNVRTK